MTFNSLGFLAFLIVVLLVLYGLPGERLRQWGLLLASYVFYGTWDARFVFLLAGVSALGYCGGVWVRRLDGSGRGWPLGLWVGLLLSPLLFFKYTNFIVSNAAALLLPSGGVAQHFDIILPIGVSFFTFQAISYVADVAAGRLAPEPSIRRFATYMAFFPHLVAGPIVRARDFLPQLHAPWRAPSRAVVGFALTRFLWGLFKKLCIADHLARSIVDPVFGNLAQASGGAIILATFAFGLQIYADFSAYGDMALSLARLLGYRLRENFDAPYLATSVRDFWRRWHMSLSLFIRDYVYVPLGGSRGLSPWRAALNALSAMVLCGIWHGAAWNFVAWGAVHGCALVLQRLLPSLPVMAVVGWVATHAFVMAAWFLFRIESTADVAILAGKLLAGGWKPGDVSRDFLPILFVDAVVVYGEQAIIRMWHGRRMPNRAKIRLARMVPAQVLMSCALAVLVVLFMDRTMTASAFIYFQF